jgi:hypothetical protein
MWDGCIDNGGILGSHRSCDLLVCPYGFAFVIWWRGESAHSFPVEAAFIRDASPVGKLGEIHFIGEVLKPSKIFLKGKGVRRECCK